MELGEQDIVGKVSVNFTKEKNGKKRQIIRIDTSNFSFYTTASKKDEISLYDVVALSVQPIDVSFKDYLSGTFYMPSYDRAVIKRDESLRQRAINFISNQHENAKISQLYSALFLGTNVFGELRDDVSNWGVAHLIAISGYHLGVISTVCFFLLKLVFKPIYARYLPYRSYIFDFMVAVFLVLCFYFYMICKKIKILNFYTLFGVILFSVALFPQLLFSVGFYFSCLGVFYIYVYLLYFSPKFSLLANSLLLNLYVFFAMEVAVLYFFPLISLLQLSVLAINYLFGVFYPLSFLLHLFGYGDIFDEILSKMLAFRLNSSNLHISTFIFLLYNAITLLCVKFKPAAFLPPLFGVASFLIFLLNFS